MYAATHVLAAVYSIHQEEFLMTQCILSGWASHERKEPTGTNTVPSDFCLSEAGHPYQTLIDVGHTVNFVPPTGVSEAMLQLLATTNEKRA